MSENTKCFTDEELLILSEGIQALEERADKALLLIKNKEVHRIMNEVSCKYCELHVKLCMMMGKV